MSTVEVRAMMSSEVVASAHLLSHMIADMARTGGQPAAGLDARLAFFTEAIRDGLAKDDRRYVVAADPVAGLVGAANAAVVTPLPVFASQSALHISTVYVAKEHRRLGVGRRLVEALLAWGRERGCPQAQLYVLDANPARVLYRAVGFADVERKMTIDL